MDDKKKCPFSNSFNSEYNLFYSSCEEGKELRKKFKLEDIINDLRSNAPVYHDKEMKRWLLTEYEDVTRVLRNKGFMRDWSEYAAEDTWGKIYPPHFGEWGVFNLDGKNHRRMRKPISSIFTPKKISDMRVRIEQIVDDHLDKIEQKESFDFVSEFADPVSALVMAEILGVRSEDLTFFVECGNDLLKIFEPDSDDETYRKGEEARRKLDMYFSSCVEQRRQAPGDDTISSLLFLEGSDLTNEEVVLTCIILILAGTVTTRDFLGNFLVLLLDNPDQLSILKNNSELIESAVDEALRVDPSVIEAPRYLAEDTTIQDVHIPKGETVTVNFASANRDPKVFDNPDTLNIERENAKKHLSFGNGVHRCAGAEMAIFESKIALERFLDRFPNIDYWDGKPDKKNVAGFSGFGKILLSASRNIKPEEVKI